MGSDSQQSYVAVDRAVDLGYVVDYDGNSVPVGAEPDIGAFERR